MSSRWCGGSDGRGYELVSSVRALVPQKFSVEEELMHVKHVDVKSPHVGVMWKFGRGVISSVSETAVGQRVWNVGVASVGLMYFGRGFLTPERRLLDSGGYGQGRKNVSCFGKCKREGGIVFNRREWNSVGEMVTTGVDRWKKV
ncbi:hypothetical protein TNCV_510101 [Trichonephila clavipes]|nr:hypothetical protein TNCV_510101 [Trichonephila clavipes]